MPAPLPQALSRVRAELLDESGLVRAVASGRRRGSSPPWRRVELRYVDLKAGSHLQVTAYDDSQAHISNHPVGDAAGTAVDDLLGQPFGSWHVETTSRTLQLRVTKKLEALVHSGPPTASAEVPTTARRAHDRAKARLLPEDAPVLAALGIADHLGRVKPSRQAKYRQVEEFLRQVEAVVAPVLDAPGAGRLRTPTPEDPLRVVDLGCGNAYLTFAAHAYLSEVRGLPVRLVGVDRQPKLLARNRAIAEDLGIAGSVGFLLGDISTVELASPPDLVLALHACDTAIDDALARAVGWEAPLVLAAPCCHHDLAAQLRRSPAPAPYPLLTSSGILRERFADTLTDAVRASALRLAGYRVEVVDFVDSRHTPRNTLLRAVRTGAPPTPQAREELAEVTRTWGVRPRITELLGDRIG